MSARRGSYATCSGSCALVWSVILAIAKGVADERRLRTIRLACAGWWLGWLSRGSHQHRAPEVPRLELPFSIDVRAG